MRSVFATFILAAILVGLPLGGCCSASEGLAELRLSASEREWLAAHPVIRLGDDFVWPPFVSMDDKGVYGGISSGYIASISKMLGITIRPIPGMTWAQVVDKVKTGGIDMLPAVVRSKERDAFLDFTKPYITFPVVIATRRDGVGVDELSDLAGRNVGVVKGYITNELLAKDFPAITLVTFDSLAAGLQALEAGKIDAVVDNLGAITYEVRRLRLAHITIAATTKYKFELSMAVRKDWPEFASILDKCLDAMSSQEKSAIENTWLAVEVNFGVNIRTIVLWALPLGTATLIVIAVVVVWNRRLNHEIGVRKQAERDLVRESTRLQTLLLTAGDGIHVLDEDGNLVQFSASFAHMLGYATEEAAGLNVVDWDAHFPRGELVGRVRALIEEPAVFETRYRRKDGSVIDVEVNGKGVVLDGRRYLYASSRDITRRKAVDDTLAQQRAELERSNAELEQFAYVTSHDLREPLRMISLYLGLIERRYTAALDDSGREFVAFAKDGAQRMDRLICDLLDYSRIGRGNEPPVPVDLGAATADALINLSAAIAESGARVEVDPSLPQVSGNRGELVRLMQNLVGNAIKYRDAARAPVVSIGCRRAGPLWEVTVTDNGIGIAAEDTGRIFGIFQRLHGREIEGTGIGLASCRKIVEQHGGTISVSGVPGQGSVFRFTLPVAEAGAIG